MKNEPCDEPCLPGQLENLIDACEKVGVPLTYAEGRSLELYGNYPTEITRRQAADLIDWMYGLVSRENAISHAVKMIRHPLASLSRPDREFAVESAKAYGLTAVEVIEAMYRSVKKV